jgi:REP-associated tyrosine transposase
MSELYQSLSYSKWDWQVSRCVRAQTTAKGHLWPNAWAPARNHPLPGQTEGVQIIEVHLMPDHVQMCIAIPPKHPMASVIGFLKGKSAIAIARLSGKERNFTGEHFWARRSSASRVHSESEGCLFQSTGPKCRRRERNFRLRTLVGPKQTTVSHQETPPDPYILQVAFLDTTDHCSDPVYPAAGCISASRPVYLTAITGLFSCVFINPRSACPYAPRSMPSRSFATGSGFAVAPCYKDYYMGRSLRVNWPSIVAAQVRRYIMGPRCIRHLISATEEKRSAAHPVAPATSSSMRIVGGPSKKTSVVKLS